MGKHIEKSRKRHRAYNVAHTLYSNEGPLGATPTDALRADVDASRAEPRADVSWADADVTGLGGRARSTVGGDGAVPSDCGVI